MSLSETPTLRIRDLDYEVGRDTCFEGESLYNNFTHQRAEVPPDPYAPKLATLQSAKSSPVEGTQSHNSRFQMLRRQDREDYLKLLEVTRCLTRIREPRELFQTVINKAVELTGAERGYLFLYASQADKKPGNFSLVASCRLREEDISSQEFRTSRSAIMQAVSLGQTILLESDAQGDAGHSLAAYGVDSVLVEPIVLQSKVLGVLYLDSRVKRLFRKEHMEMLPSFTAQVAICVENIRLSNEREVALKRQQAEQAHVLELQVQKETMSTFLEKASCELKGPLTVLKTGLTVLLRQKDEELRGQVHRDLERAIDKASSVIDDFLHSERDQSGGDLQIEREVFDLRALVESEVKLALQTLEPHRRFAFRFEVDLAANRPIWVDKDSLSQVLNILLANSVKYSPQGGEIKITHSGTANHDILSISDQGLGMQAGSLEDVLKAFHRTRKDVAREGHSNGLQMVKRLMDAHSGSVCIESKSDGGTVVWLAFPRKSSSTTPVY